MAMAFLVATADTSTAQSASRMAVELAGSYLASFESAVAGVVLEETYTQQEQSTTSPGTRLLSDLVVVADETEGFVEFRDIHTVDGHPVTDRQQRIVTLFTRAGSDARQQARALIAEGARHNVAPQGVKFERTINLPLTALRYLVRRHQSRVRYTTDGQTTMFGRAVTIVRYEERGHPRIVGSPDASPADGRFWIEERTGRVLQSEMHLRSRRGNTTIAAAIHVQYAAAPDLNLWLPGMMEEDYVFIDSRERVTARLSGRALYANAKRFGVKVDESLQPHPN